MDPVLLRKQLQDNASDLQEFCKDLKNWGEEMKQKEKSLKSDNNETTQGRPERKKQKKTLPKTKSKETSTKKPVRRIGTTNYAAWDKFDADAECEKLDDDINEDSELTDEHNDNLQDLAIIEKEEGNKFVKNQKWDEAIKCYTKAIEYYTYDPIFYANRALCYLKNNNFEKAEEDCNLSLKLDNTYVKAYQRRAAARESLNKLEHAEFDLMKVLELEPKNVQSRESLDRLRRKIGKIDKVAEQKPVSKFTASRNKSSTSNLYPEQSLKPDVKNTDLKNEIDTSKPVPPWPDDEDIIPVRAINKPPHLRSNKPLKRIEITEKDGSMMFDKQEREEAVKEHVFEKREEAVKEHVVEKREENLSVFKQKSISKPVLGSDEKNNLLDLKITEVPPVPPVSIKDIKNTVNSDTVKDKSTQNDLVAEFKKPKTSVQFNLTWRSLKKKEDKYKYLKLVDAQDIPKIFLNSLESSVFSEILEVLVEYFVANEDPVYDILEYFTKVNRFGTFTMFMSSADKKNLWKLFDCLKEYERKNKEDVDRLIQKYEL